MILYNVYVDCIYDSTYVRLEDALLCVKLLNERAVKTGNNPDILLRVTSRQNEWFSNDC